MKRVIYHVIVPALMPAMFLAIASTPVALFGCRTRGLIVLLVTLGSAAASLTSTLIAAKKRRRGDPDASWWAVSGLIMTIPVAGLLLAA